MAIQPFVASTTDKKTPYDDLHTKINFVLAALSPTCAAAATIELADTLNDTPNNFIGVRRQIMRAFIRKYGKGVTFNAE